MKLRLLYPKSLFRIGAELRMALEQGGVEIASKADVALHLSTTSDFDPVPDARNVLWATDVTTPDLSPGAVARLRVADAILATGSMLRELLMPVTQNCCVLSTIVPLGFAPSAFRPVLRTDAPRTQASPLRVLWVGDLDPRGDLGLLGALWAERFADQPWITLTVAAPGVKPEHKGNVHFAPTPLAPRSRVSLLRSHHVMVSFGHLDRAGLTELEALATGLPLVTSAWAPPLDYPLHDCAEVVDYEVDYDRHGNEVVTANPGELGRRLERVVRNYDDAAWRAFDAVRIRPFAVEPRILDAFRWPAVIEQLKRALAETLSGDARAAA
ncbi:hypothetical protein K2Z84_05280 [Candidatus Binatia bacterium]|nr:hypothetical protein [Candidatus Binatia bacterium]